MRKSGNNNLDQKREKCKQQFTPNYRNIIDYNYNYNYNNNSYNSNVNNTNDNIINNSGHKKPANGYLVLV